jgi:hypothetical protein
VHYYPLQEIGEEQYQYEIPDGQEYFWIGQRCNAQLALSDLPSYFHNQPAAYRPVVPNPGQD